LGGLKENQQAARLGSGPGKGWNVIYYVQFWLGKIQGGHFSDSFGMILEFKNIFPSNL
jgi:hypothetical protein